MNESLASKRSIMDKRRTLQWMLTPIVLFTLVFGWKYVWLGFVVPIVMIMGIAGGMVRGRYVCGNLCPRGSFFDRIISKIAGKKEIPATLRAIPLRLGVLALLMGFMVWRLAADPSNLEHWGFVFWSMCAITTAVGVALALVYHPRTWCAVCPVGTLSNVIGGDKYQLDIDADCRECGRCEQSCTFNLPIVVHKSHGIVQERDCIKCSVCATACPKGALNWPDAA